MIVISIPLAIQEVAELSWFTAEMAFVDWRKQI
jgi:hypothetical protein